jgi:hypothetical protein
MGRSMGKGGQRSRLWREWSALLTHICEASLDPEAEIVHAHSECEHLARLPAVSINPMKTDAMKVEGREGVESLMTTAALASVAAKFLAAHDFTPSRPSALAISSGSSQYRLQ